jgi:hypothetical protein
MRYNWRKYIAIFLLLPVGFNAVGNTFVYITWRVLMQAHIKEIAATVPLQQLVKITQKNTLDIVDEFEWQGKMYDVVKQEVQGNEIIYYCINDFEEDQIAQNYQDTQNDLNTLQHKAKKTANNIAKKIFKPILALINTAYPPSNNAKTLRWFNESRALVIGSVEALLLPPKTNV